MFFVCFFLPLQKQFAENANKKYHIYKVIAVLHVYNKILGIRLAGHPANKNKNLILLSSILKVFKVSTASQYIRYVHAPKYFTMMQE